MKSRAVKLFVFISLISISFLYYAPVGADKNTPFLIGNGVAPETPYPCDVTYKEELQSKKPYPYNNMGFLFYPHRILGLGKVFPQNIAFISRNIVPYAPGLVFAGAAVEHGDVTFRPENGPADLLLSEPFNKHSLAGLASLCEKNGIIPARHLSLSGMILEQLPTDAREKGWINGIKESAVGRIKSGHTMVFPNYNNPEVLKYLEDTFDILTNQVGFKYYWLDNWTAKEEVFLNVYQAIREGAGRHGAPVLLRSGAGPSQVGLIDILAPAPDVQHDWYYIEQLFDERMIHSFLNYCPNAFKLGFDDFYINQPFSLDQARFLASLYGILGAEITVTEGEFYKTPLSRVEVIQKVLPLPVTGPLQSEAPSGSHIWVECIERSFETWHVAAFFNPERFEPMELALDLSQLDEYSGPVLAWDFWDERFLGVFDENIRVHLGPSSCLVMALKKYTGRPQLLSTNRHILQGAEEIENCTWSQDNQELSGVFTRGVEGKSFSLFIYIPDGWKLKNFDGKISDVKENGSNILEVGLKPFSGNLSWNLSFTLDGTVKTPDFCDKEPVFNTLGELVDKSTRLDSAWYFWKDVHAGRSFNEDEQGEWQPLPELIPDAPDYASVVCFPRGEFVPRLRTQVTIPSKWKDHTLRLYIADAKKTRAVAVNGVTCEQVLNPAQRYTAWYDTRECVYELPQEAIKWGEENEIIITSSVYRHLLWMDPRRVGLQVDMGND